MTQGLATTPFGRRAMSLGVLAAQARTRETPAGKTVHKWKVVQALTEAKDKLGLPDRSLAVLNALLSFHQETTMTAGDPLVVFPSNAKLAARAHGVAHTTLRRHLAILVEQGIVLRKDSPNGKRYARRGEGGELADAFGFDLTPLVTRAEEFDTLAAEVRDERNALRLARERVTIARRDVTKLIALGMEEGIAGDWQALHATYLALVGRLKRSSTLDVLQSVAQEAEDMAKAIASHLELFINSQKTDGNESHFGQHKQNSKPDSSELELASEEIGTEATEHREQRVSLDFVLKACPDMVQYASNPAGEAPTIKTWSEFLKTASLVRAMLGISPDAWRDALETMGPADASIVVAAILQKGDDIRFPGGYLRALTEKKRAGAFAVGPILMALINSGLKSVRVNRRRDPDL